MRRYPRLTFTTTDDETFACTPKTASDHKLTLLLTFKAMLCLAGVEVDGPDLITAMIYEHLHTIRTQIERCDLLSQGEFYELLSP